MLLSSHAMRRTLVGVIGTGAVLLSGASFASAEPVPAPPPPAPPGCSAGDLAQASGTVGTAMAGYFFTHPEVNNFFTSLRGLQTRRFARTSGLPRCQPPGRVRDQRDSPTCDRFEESLRCPRTGRRTCRAAWPAVIVCVACKSHPGRVVRSKPT